MLKSILVPTDFSACAADALHSAALLAQKFHAKIYLCHFMELPNGWAEKTFPEKEKYQDALQDIRNAEVLMQEFTRIHSNLDVIIHHSGRNLIDGIHQVILEHGIDLVVIGSHGAGGKNEYFIGSNSQKVIRKVNCNVLVIKNRIKVAKFEKVVFASSFREEELESFSKFKDFIAPFIPEIHLVYINSNPFFGQPFRHSVIGMEEFKKAAGPFKCYTHYFKNLTVDAGVRALAKEIGADLIAISNHSRKPVKRILSSSHVEALVNHAELPVLSIDY